MAPYTLAILRANLERARVTFKTYEGAAIRAFQPPSKLAAFLTVGSPIQAERGHTRFATSEQLAAARSQCGRGWPTPIPDLRARPAVGRLGGASGLIGEALFAPVKGNRGRCSAVSLSLFREKNSLFYARDAGARGGETHRHSLGKALLGTAPKRYSRAYIR